MPIENRMKALITEETALLHAEIHHLAARVQVLEKALGKLEKTEPARTPAGRRA